jgi:hypothetical protein
MRTLVVLRKVNFTSRKGTEVKGTPQHNFDPLMIFVVLDELQFTVIYCTKYSSSSIVDFVFRTVGRDRSLRLFVGCWRTPSRCCTVFRLFELEAWCCKHHMIHTRRSFHQREFCEASPPYPVPKNGILPIEACGHSSLLSIRCLCLCRETCRLNCTDERT